MIKDAYEALCKRLKGLPEFDVLDQEFEISQLEDEQFLLRAIKKRMQERLDDLACMLGDIVHPGQETVSLMHEWRFFDAKEKKALYQVFRKLKFFIRSFDEADLMQQEEHDVKLVAEVSHAWKELREKCIPYATRLKEAWTKEEGVKEELGYFG